MAFRTELENLLNKHCIEKGSNTPDYVLAQFIDNMLMAFDIAVNNRERSYGRNGVKDKYKIREEELYDYDGEFVKDI